MLFLLFYFSIFTILLGGPIPDNTNSGVDPFISDGFVPSDPNEESSGSISLDPDSAAE